MKKLPLLGILSVAIIAAGVMFSQSTNAQTAVGQVSLQVTSSNGTCSYATGVSAPSISASFSTWTTTGDFTSNFVCTGTNSSASTLTIMSAQLTGPNTYVIPAANVKAASVGITAAWDTGCQAGVTMTGNNFLGISSAQTILARNNQGRLCTLTATGVKVAVTVPGGSPVGTYTGTLTFTETTW